MKRFIDKTKKNYCPKIDEDIFFWKCKNCPDFIKEIDTKNGVTVFECGYTKNKRSIIKKEDIGMNEGLKIQGRLGLNNQGEPYKSFNGKQTLEQARNFAIALLVAVNKAEQKKLDEIDIVFGPSGNDNNDNNFLMVGYN